MANHPNRRPRRYRYDCLLVLLSLGFDESDTRRLLLASNRLHRWHEWECGTETGAIERDEETGELRWYNNRSHKWGRYYGKDYETLAKAMIARVMAKHPTLTAYIQGDPRGCALYILRAGRCSRRRRSGRLLQPRDFSLSGGLSDGKPS